MAGKRLVELGRDVVELEKARPRDGWEVVVLVVQAHVVREEVQGAVVGVCLRWHEGGQRRRRIVVLLGMGLLALLLYGFRAAIGFGEEIVLRDEVTGARVEGAREERAEDQVVYRLQGGAGGLVEEEVEG